MRCSGQKLTCTLSSIGAACARALWDEGTSLALTYFQSREPVDELARELQKQFSSDERRVITTHRVDTGSAEAIAHLFKDIKEQHGQDGPDILVSNAGYGKRR